MDQKIELIGDTLKKYRKLHGFSVSQVSALMQKNYNLKVAAKTIYGWESNQCYPPAQKMLALCELYQISDLATTFSPKKESQNFAITPLERRIVQGFRDNPQMRPAVCRLLEVENPAPFDTK